MISLLWVITPLNTSTHTLSTRNWLLPTVNIIMQILILSMFLLTCFYQKIMQKKGLSIFQKLFFAFLGVGLITLIISGTVHYRSKKEFIERTIAFQLSDSLRASIDYFNRTYTIPIKKDLGFIETSSSLNNFLTSQKDEALLTKPPAERLFLHFTGIAESIYLSSRFIDSKGEEKIITAGNKRVRDYATIDHFPNNVLYRRIYSLFKRLKSKASLEAKNIMSLGLVIDFAFKFSIIACSFPVRW